MSYKTVLTAGLLLMGTAVLQADTCASRQGCAKKICELQKKVEMTTEPHALARLQKALAEAKANCSDSDLKARAQAKADAHTQKIERKIDEASADAKKAENRMKDAQAEGRSDKAAKYRHKMEEKLQKVKKLQTQL